MAVTRLLHMKEEPGFPSSHLKNTIDYILDVKNNGKKTEYGKWVGGNVGTEATEIYHTFIDTKKFYGKEFGRQGYHFVISFPPETINEMKCYQVAKEFCEEYFGDEYEYVFAVHNDKNHKHAHIIFNSVNRSTGSKYRYEKGDWEKSIQPITDEVCKRHELPELKIEKEQKGVSYQEWGMKNKGDIRAIHILRADIDYAIENASNMTEFYKIMAKLNYHLRHGISKKHGSYIAYKFIQEDGKEFKRRSYHKDLGSRYSAEGIAKRIFQKDKEESYYHRELSEKLADKVKTRLGQSAVINRTNSYKRLYQAVSYYKLPNPFAIPASQVRQDMLRIDKLIEECAYLKKNPKMTQTQLDMRLTNINEQLHELYVQRKVGRELESTLRLMLSKEDMERYRQLKIQLENISDWNESCEQAQDELRELEERLPISFIKNVENLKKYESSIEVLKKEKKILERIIETEKDVILDVNTKLKQIKTL